MYNASVGEQIITCQLGGRMYLKAIIRPNIWHTCYKRDAQTQFWKCQDFGQVLLISNMQDALCNKTNVTNRTNNLVQFFRCNWIFDDDFLYSVKQWAPFPMSITSTSLSGKRLQHNCFLGYKSLLVPSVQIPRDKLAYLWLSGLFICE